MKLQTRFWIAAVAGLCSLTLGACASTAQTAPEPAARSIVNGPAADYPIVIGEPFTIDGITYTPLDTMNFDQVGYVALDREAGGGVTGSHRTLPLPCYVEVTSLESGRTILVRLERRGPMTNKRLIGLSPAALAQLGESDGAAVRMRRVNPPEDDRMELRAGRDAPLRMDTPQGLLQVLKRRLPEEGSAPLTDPRQAEVSGKVPTQTAIASVDPNDEIGLIEAPEAEDMPEENTPEENVPAEDNAEDAALEAAPEAAPRPGISRPTLPMAVQGGPTRAPVMVPTSTDGKFSVQLGAFSVRANADALAREVQGYVETSGNLALVRVGPFATRGQAEQALAMLRERGYRDALIRSLD